MLPGQPAGQQLPVTNNKFAQLIQLLMTSQPLSQLMQGGVAPAGGPSAQLTARSLSCAVTFLREHFPAVGTAIYRRRASTRELIGLVNRHAR